MVHVTPSKLLEAVVGEQVKRKKGVLLAYLIENERSFTPRAKLIKHVYKDDSKLGSFNACLNGIVLTLEKKNIDWEIRKERNEGQILYGLFPIKGQ